MSSFVSFIYAFLGPMFVLFGLGLMVSQDYYKKLLKKIDDEPLAVLVMGIFALFLGILIITQHNYWDSVNNVILSVMGWMSFIKGIVLIILPTSAEPLMKWYRKNNLLTVSSVFIFILGCYFSLLAYFPLS